MSMFCATVACLCHPSGSAQAPPGACTLVLTVWSSARSAPREESVMKGRHRTAHRPTPRSDDAPCRLASPRGMGSDTATPSRLTTSALCRQKCNRRQNASRDRMSSPRQNSPKPRRHRVDKAATLELAKKNNLADLAHTATSAD